MTPEELKAIFIKALRKAGIKASPKQIKLAEYVFACEVVSKDAEREIAAQVSAT